jgi:hypothetical protein
MANKSSRAEIQDGSSETDTAVVNIYVPPPLALTAVDDYYNGTYNLPFSPPDSRLITLNDVRCSRMIWLVCVCGLLAIQHACLFLPLWLLLECLQQESRCSRHHRRLGPLAVACCVCQCVRPHPAHLDFFSPLFPSPNANPQLEIVAAGTPTSGTGTLLSWAKNGSFVFQPNTGWSGTTMFPYTVTDVGTGLNASAKVYITIVPPVRAVDDSYIGMYDEDYSPPASQLILLNDGSDSPTPQLEVVAAGPLASGSGVLVSWSSNGSFVFRPTSTWNGEWSG